MLSVVCTRARAWGRTRQTAPTELGGGFHVPGEGGQRNGMT